MEMEYTICKMKKEDLRQIQNLVRISWHKTYEGIIPLELQNKFLDYAYSNKMMEKRLMDSLILVVKVNGVIVGFINFSIVNTNGEVELVAIYLDPNYQGKKLGTALLSHGIMHLKGAKHLFVDVEKENKTGLCFYEAKGFKRISEFDDNFSGHILKTVRLELDIKTINMNACN